MGNLINRITINKLLTGILCVFVYSVEDAEFVVPPPWELFTSMHIFFTFYFCKWCCLCTERPTWCIIFLNRLGKEVLSVSISVRHFVLKIEQFEGTHWVLIVAIENRNLVFCMWQSKFPVILVDTTVHTEWGTCFI